MDLLLCILGLLQKISWALPATGAGSNKLHKKHREQKIKKICSREVLNAVRKSSMGLCLQSQEALGLMTAHLTSPESLCPQLLNHNASRISNTSSSLYSIDQMQQENFQRTRPKTPILQVGQRENLIEQSHGRASKLAADYQAALSSQLTCEENLLNHQPSRKLRKVKSQTSLRDMSRDQAEARVTSPSMESDGDVDTLIGSEPASPGSKIQDKFWRIPSSRKPSFASIKSFQRDTDIGLQICVDLLTNELASILFRHHPIEDHDRASELQILLMIEAYETIQKQIHENCVDPYVSSGQMRHLEQLLDNWLSVLYDLYERSRQVKVDTTNNIESNYLNSPTPLQVSRDQLKV